MSTTKPFDISKKFVWEAYKKVKKNKGSAGVDDESILDFEANLKDNLYKIWNRLSSGSYFPPPVKLVEIPKKDGRVRQLGIPTVSDRIAQMVVKMSLEPEVEMIFHPDSYGYRPNKSAHNAIGTTRGRCWQYSWVLDLDIKGFFDNIDHKLMLKAVNKHAKNKWVSLYIERWLKSPIQYPDGSIHERSKGTPQGGVISPLLANLYLHYAFDSWLERQGLNVKFERYADDIIVHCKTKEQANRVMSLVSERLLECKLELNTDKTKMVYCKRSKGKCHFGDTNFDFLGFCFRTRLVRNKNGSFFISFTPSISKAAANSVRETMRKWKLHTWTSKSLLEIAEAIGPIIRGWINYDLHP